MKDYSSGFSHDSDDFKSSVGCLTCSNTELLITRSTWVSEADNAVKSSLMI